MESTENNNKASVGLAGTGLGLGAGALGLLLLQNGAFGNMLGGNRLPVEPPATKTEVNYERQLTEKDMKIAQLSAEKYADTVVLAAERRLADKIEKIETQLNATTTTQAVINAQQTGIIATLQGQVMQLNNMTGLYIKQPVMAASEAALTALKPAAATAATTGN